MSRNRRRRDKGSLLDKIADQTLSAALSFLFTAALIGGSSYILFQLPPELQAVDRQKQEAASQYTHIRQFNDMLAFFATGWFADSTNWQPEEVFFGELPRNIDARALNPALKQEMLSWATSSLLRLSSERGHIEGLVLQDDLERSLQQQLLKIYGIRISLTTQLEEMVLNWEEEQPQSRDKRLASLQVLKLESLGYLQGLFPKVNQLQEQSAIVRQQFRQRERELNSQSRNIYLKVFFAALGIATGVALMIIVSRAVLMKHAHGQRNRP
jgi:hypothetical protein